MTARLNDIAVFEFSIKAPAAGSYNESFALVIEGVTWVANTTVTLPITVTPAWAGTVTSIEPAGSVTLAPGETRTIRTSVLNLGNKIWQPAPGNGATGYTNLGTAGPADRSSTFRDTSWLSANRATALDTPRVLPGESGLFEFILKAPAVTGSYDEAFQVVVDGASWVTGATFSIPINVQ